MSTWSTTTSERRRHDDEKSPASRSKHPGELPGPARPECLRGGTGAGRRPSYPLAGAERPRGHLPGDGHPAGEGRLVQRGVLAAPPDHLQSRASAQGAGPHRRRAIHAAGDSMTGLDAAGASLDATATSVPRISVTTPLTRLPAHRPGPNRTPRPQGARRPRRLRPSPPERPAPAGSVC